VNDKHFTIEEYQEKIKPAQTDKNERLVMLYTNNPAMELDNYTIAAQSAGYDVLKFDQPLDNHFIQKLETSLEGVTFTRVDSNTLDKLIDKDEKRESVLSEKQQEKVKTIFTEQVTDMGASVSLEALSPDEQPVIITKPEFMRRMREMSAMQGMDMGAMPDSYNVVVNTNHPLIADKLIKLLNQGMLRGTDLSSFINKSIEYLTK